RSAPPRPRGGGADAGAGDGIAARRARAAAFGAAHVLDPAADDVGERVRRLTDGGGADVCIEISGSYRALHEAVRSCAVGGRVVAAGFYQGAGLGPRLGEELHRTQLQRVSAQLSAAPR